MRSFEPSGGACWALSRAASVVVSVADTAANYGKSGQSAVRGAGSQIRRLRACVTSRAHRLLKYPRRDADDDARSAAASARPWRATRRPGLRGELRRPGGRARACRLGGTGADRRPLRDRRAPDLGLRRAHRVARRDGRPGRRSSRPSAIWSSTRPTSTTRMRLPWTFSTFDYPTLCELLFEQCDAEFETATVDGRTGTTVHTDRGDLERAAGRRLPGLAPRPRRQRLPAHRGATVARARGPPGRSARRPRDLDRPRLRPRRLRLELPGPRRGPGRGRLLRSRASTSRTRPSGWRRTSTATPFATRATGSPTSCASDRGRDLLRRRLRRALPAADRRGNPHRVLLRDRLRAGASPGGRRASDARRGAARYAAFSAAPRWHFRWLLRVQRLVPRVPPRLLALALRGMSQRRVRALVVRPLPADRAARIRREAGGRPEPASDEPSRQPPNRSFGSRGG